MDLMDSMLENSNQAQQGDDQSKAWLGRTTCKAMMKRKLEAKARWTVEVVKCEQRAWHRWTEAMVKSKLEAKVTTNTRGSEV